MLDVPAAEIVLPGGVVHDVRRRRVLSPLLDHLSASAPAPAGVERLARQVWESHPSASVTNAIKMAVARLRKLLGEQGTWIETRRLGDGQLAYRLAPDARVWVVREAKPD